MLMKKKKKISKEVRRRLLERRTRIFTKWLKINFEKPYTIFLAAFFPFAQTFLASVIVIYTDPTNSGWETNLSLFINLNKGCFKSSNCSHFSILADLLSPVKVKSVFI